MRFKDTAFFRQGSIKKKLKTFPDRERELWRTLDKKPFEIGIAMERVAAETVLDLIDYPSYFSLLETPIPNGHTAILGALQEENLIKPNNAGHWDITCLGAILFAKKLGDFPTLKRKALRIVQYKGNNKVETLREYDINKGYATGFEELINQIITLVPTNEFIGQALRKAMPMYPELAIRELVANALIHQDFFVTGTAPMVELFDTRIEITNPGLPLVATDRFLDTPPKSRNETLASLMRRLRICEERGSGIDKVVLATELFQLPPPIFETTDAHTRTILFAHKQFKEMDKTERIWACYLHACLRYVQRNLMTNTSLRERFGIDPKNSSIVSRVIKDTLSAGRIHYYDDSVGNKAKKYCPSWAKTIA